MATVTGHRQDSMGVCGHSAGEIFPAVIMIKGSFEEGFTYHVLNHPNVEDYIMWHSYAAAERHATYTPRF